MADQHRHTRQSLAVPAGSQNPNLRPQRRPRADPEALANGVLAADRSMLGQALSLVESTRPADRSAASQLLNRLQIHAGASVRLAISGSPGVGKSTLIDALGMALTASGHRVAVLAVDPSSERTGGSILGDKTRMPRLAADEAAFIRPSPSAGFLGGVGRYTRPAITLCEAAGFNVLILETVGVGQSEVAARGMSDFFLLLSLAGAGDELQGIKRGIVEVADAIAVTKADGKNAGPAKAAAARLRTALRLFPPDASGWRPEVLTCSAQTGDGIASIWELVERFKRIGTESGAWESRRASQRVAWFEEELIARQSESLEASRSEIQRELREQVAAGALHPYAAVEAFLEG